MKRFRMSSKGSKRDFTRKAVRKDKRNFREAGVMRGGYRL